MLYLFDKMHNIVSIILYLCDYSDNTDINTLKLSS